MAEEYSKDAVSSEHQNLGVGCLYLGDKRFVGLMRGNSTGTIVEVGWPAADFISIKREIRTVH